MSTAAKILVLLGSSAPVFGGGCMAASGSVADVPTPRGVTGISRYDWEMGFRKRMRRNGRWMAWGTLLVDTIAIILVLLV